VSDVFGSRPAWSPDGRQLAYVGTNGIGVVGLDGSNPHVVSAPGAFAGGPSWSPDGTRIVFSRNNPQGYPGELYIARVDGSGEQPLTSDGFENASPSWSPNGTQVVFQRTSFAPGGWKLWAIGVDGTGLRQLTTGSSDLSPDWGSAQVAPPPPPPAAPTIQIFSPVDGATYLPGMQVSAIYFCTSIDPYLAVGCHGDLPFGAPLDLSSAGAHRFTVETIDELGRTASASVTYFVADLTPPVVDLRVPKDGAVYGVGAQLTVDYSCADPNGVGVALCQGSLPPGAPLDTSHAGTYTFTVSTADKALNFRQVTATYTVVGRSPQSISFASIPDRSYGDPPFVVGATGGGSGNPVSFTASGQCTVSGSTVTITGAGTCTVTAHQDGNANYQPAPDVSQTFTIARAGQAISFASCRMPCSAIRPSP